MKKAYTLLMMFVSVLTLIAQNKSGIDINASVDLYSRYVWRGLLFTDAPSIQPSITVSKGGFSATVWGSYATSKNYAEVDLFLAYSTGNLTFGLSDYYTENERDLTLNDFTDWKQEETVHLVETYISYQLPVKKFPMTITGSIFVYGADLDKKNNQNFSSYVELSYPFSLNDYDLSLTLGGTPTSGYYSKDAGLVNLSFGAIRTIKITETFSIPVNTSIVINPSNKDVFLIIGFSL